ncbi:helix-turn-helix transcriptional regulator [Candidatus Palauibacter sp.]|uniref:helix-turn-helix transcriptional regulator n=1 Tax=Candidatus Palauibacter sp. TaxID=3101350 RepID=UPI003B012ADB
MQSRTPLELGLLIRKARHARGMTQADLARAAGVGRQWVVAIEAGKPRAELGKAFQTLAALDLSLSIHGEGIPEPSGSRVRIAVPDIEAVVRAHEDPAP